MGYIRYKMGAGFAGRNPFGYLAHARRTFPIVAGDVGDVVLIVRSK